MAINLRLLFFILNDTMAKGKRDEEKRKKSGRTTRSNN